MQTFDALQFLPLQSPPYSMQIASFDLTSLDEQSNCFLVGKGCVVAACHDIKKHSVRVGDFRADRRTGQGAVFVACDLPSAGCPLGCTCALREGTAGGRT